MCVHVLKRNRFGTSTNTNKQKIYPKRSNRTNRVHIFCMYDVAWMCYTLCVCCIQTFCGCSFPFAGFVFAGNNACGTMRTQHVRTRVYSLHTLSRNSRFNGHMCVPVLRVCMCGYAVWCLVQNKSTLAGVCVLLCCAVPLRAASSVSSEHSAYNIRFGGPTICRQ